MTVYTFFTYVNPFRMWCLSACRIMLVIMLLAVYGLVGVVVSEKAASVSSVYFSNLLSYNCCWFVYVCCLSSSCLFVMPLMFTSSMDMPVARGVLLGLCGVFLGASFLLFACVGVECCVGDAVWFRTCALAPAPTCGLAARTDVGPEFDSTSPAQSIRSASQDGNICPRD